MAPPALYALTAHNDVVATIVVVVHLVFLAVVFFMVGWYSAKNSMKKETQNKASE
jgi:uncharacterized membrane protein YwzB